MGQTQQNPRERSGTVVRNLRHNVRKSRQSVIPEQVHSIKWVQLVVDIEKILQW